MTEQWNAFSMEAIDYESRITNFYLVLSGNELKIRHKSELIHEIRIFPDFGAFF